jgi:voltage-gated potassium channel
MALIKRKHATAKAYVHDWLEPDQPGGINFFSGTIIALVIVSLITLALETEAARSDTVLDAWVRPLVAQINLFVVWIFAAEFALRFWSEGENPEHKGFVGRLKFLIQPVTIADVLAF